MQTRSGTALCGSPTLPVELFYEELLPSCSSRARGEVDAPPVLLIMGVGLAIGPAVASMIMGAWSPVGLFVVTALFHGLLAVAAFLRMRIRRSIDAADRAPFQPMTNDGKQTLESIVLDPRTESEEDTEMPVDEPILPEELATPIDTPNEDKRDVQD